MATLIAVYDSSGCVGRCDARCYDAKEPGCDCICGGKNHGAGQHQATENTRGLCTEWMKEFETQHSIVNPSWCVPASQLALPI